MNKRFNEYYIRLLKKQVEIEINFLVSNEHDKDKITIPCMFCFELDNYYKCRRLTDLRQFQSQLYCYGKNPGAERKQLDFATIAEALHTEDVIAQHVEEFPIISD